MSRSKQWVAELVASVANVDQATADMVVERLMEENLLHIGYGNAEIDQVVEAFSENFGTTKTTRYDRFAANRLVSKYGVQTVVGVINLLRQGRDIKYAPVVGSITQLESKWVSVLNFLRTAKAQDDETIQL